MAQTRSVKPIKKGKEIWLPIPSDLFRRLKPDRGRGAPLLPDMLHWTAVDGVLQLTLDAPAAIPIMTGEPDKRFRAQR